MSRTCQVGGFAVAIFGLALLAACGCSASHHCCANEDLPAGCELPEGFHALRGHTNAGDLSDNYDNWPRFIFNSRDHMVMVYVPSQTFMMGGGTQPDEVPARQVHVEHFYVDLHEVTNVQFDCFRRSGGGSKCPIHDTCEGEESPGVSWMELEGSYGDRCFNPWYCCCAGDPCKICQYKSYWTPCVNDNHPVRNVSWCEAWAYSNWAGKQLPSEAQWEAAARGDDRRIYPWGNQEQSEVTRYLCNSRTSRENFDGYEYTAPVLTYAAGVSPFGAFNMAGNVAEWCGDWYDLGRYGYPSDEDPPTGLQRGPKAFGDRYYPNPWDKDAPDARVGPMRGGARAIRGGSFADPIERCRVDVRSSAGPAVHLNNVGFRTILPLPHKS